MAIVFIFFSGIVSSSGLRSGVWVLEAVYRFSEVRVFISFVGRGECG